MAATCVQRSVVFTCQVPLYDWPPVWCDILWPGRVLYGVYAMLNSMTIVTMSPCLWCLCQYVEGVKTMMGRSQGREVCRCDIVTTCFNPHRMIPAVFFSLLSIRHRSWRLFSGNGIDGLGSLGLSRLGKQKQPKHSETTWIWCTVNTATSSKRCIPTWDLSSVAVQHPIARSSLPRLKIRSLQMSRCMAGRSWRNYRIQRCSECSVCTFQTFAKAQKGSKRLAGWKPAEPLMEIQQENQGLTWNQSGPELVESAARRHCTEFHSYGLPHQGRTRSLASSWSRWRREVADGFPMSSESSESSDSHGNRWNMVKSHGKSSDWSLRIFLIWNWRGSSFTNWS